tara:strand:+ start:434 stop:640 length:207 start_codon:yes stop_codon:yes gene_type:complete
MKWCSLLDEEDLTEMKQLHKKAINNKEEFLKYKGTSYKTSYVESVISYIEDLGHHNINNYKESDDLIY